MKIVLLTNWFSDGMGYIENCLPKAMARLGHEVHVVSSTAQVYYCEPHYRTVYEPHLGAGIREPGTTQLNGFTLHLIPFGEFRKKIYLRELKRTLEEIRPDVVQTFDALSFITLQASCYKLVFGYELFTANHIVASVFPLLREKADDSGFRIAFFLTRTLPGRIVSWVTSRCYPATIDAQDIAVKYYGIPRRKTKLLCLGVDTEFFHPAADATGAERSEARRRLDLREHDIVCIYTGRFTGGKNPLCLARAIDRLSKEGRPFRGLFMGDGPQAGEIAALAGCTVHPFVPHQELPAYYRLSDIGVWPREESTSMLDAAACGLPIVISDQVQAMERVEGNGLVYRENDVASLREALLKLEDAAARRRLGEAGMRKMSEQFSWTKLAKERLEDYRSFVDGR